MKKFVVAMLALVSALLLGATGASAFEGGGRKPSEAPLILSGQHYVVSLNNIQSEANYEGGYSGYHYEVALYRLPPVGARDQVTVSWHVLPFAHASGFPICMVLMQGIDDFTWGGIFGSATGGGERNCSESGPVYSVSGTGTGRNTITMQSPDASTYLAFYGSPDVSVGHVTVTLPGSGGHSPPSFSIAREISA